MGLLLRILPLRPGEIGQFDQVGGRPRDVLPPAIRPMPDFPFVANLEEYP
jgi:hypothetical protein